MKTIKNWNKMYMRKIVIVIVLSVLCTRAFAFEHICSAQVKVSPRDPALTYDFFAVNLNSMADILSLGLFIRGDNGGKVFVNAYTFTNENPTRVLENNTDLSQAVKDKMRQVKSNLCMTVESDGSVIVNIFIPNNGRYTTIVYENRRTGTAGRRQRGSN